MPEQIKKESFTYAGLTDSIEGFNKLSTATRENIKLKEIIITSKIKKEPTVIHERKTQL